MVQLAARAEGSPNNDPSDEITQPGRSVQAVPNASCLVKLWACEFLSIHHTVTVTTVGGS